jgi:hypothetical protein
MSEKGFLIGPAFAGALKELVDKDRGGVSESQYTRIETRFEDLPSRRSEKTFRICTFTGAWATSDTKTVTFKNQTTTPNTVSVVNLFFPLASTATTSTDCAIAKDGTAWYLVDVPFETATAVFISATQSTSQVTDITLSATLNTSNCAITIGKTLVTATAIFVQTTFTSTFVRFRG